MNERKKLDITSNIYSKISRDYFNTDKIFKKTKIFKMSIFSVILILFGIILIIINLNNKNDFFKNSEEHNLINCTFSEKQINLLFVKKNKNKNFDENYKKKYSKKKNYFLRQTSNSSSTINDNDILNSNIIRMAQIIDYILYSFVIILFSIMISFIFINLKSVNIQVKRIFYIFYCLIFSFFNFFYLKIFFVLLFEIYDINFLLINLLANSISLFLFGLHIYLLDSNFKINLISLIFVNLVFFIFIQSFTSIAYYNFLLNILNDLFIILVNFIYEKIKVNCFVYSFLFFNAKNEFKATLDKLDYSFISIDENMDLITNERFINEYMKNKEFKQIRDLPIYKNLDSLQFFNLLKKMFQNIFNLKTFAHLIESLLILAHTEKDNSNLLKLSDREITNVNKDKSLKIFKKGDIISNIIYYKDSFEQTPNSNNNNNLLSKRDDEYIYNLNNQFKSEQSFDKNIANINKFLKENKNDLNKLIDYSKQFNYEINDYEKDMIIYEDSDLKMKILKKYFLKTKLRNNNIQKSLTHEYEKENNDKYQNISGRSSRLKNCFLDNKERFNSPPLKKEKFLNPCLKNFSHMENSQNDSNIFLYKKLNINKISKKLLNEKKKSHLHDNSKNKSKNKNKNTELSKKKDSNNKKKYSERINITKYTKDDKIKINLEKMKELLKNLLKILPNKYIEIKRPNFPSLNNDSSSCNIIYNKDFFIRKNETSERIEFIFKSELNNSSKKNNNINLHNKYSNNEMVKKDKKVIKSKFIKNDTNDFPENKSVHDENKNRNNNVHFLVHKKKDLKSEYNFKNLNESSLFLLKNLQNKISHELINPVVNLINFLKESRNFVKENIMTAIFKNTNTDNYNIRKLSNLSNMSLNSSSLLINTNNSITNKNYITIKDKIKKQVKNNQYTERSNMMSMKNDDNLITLKRSNNKNYSKKNTIVDTNGLDKNSIPYIYNDTNISCLSNKNMFNRLIRNLEDSKSISKMIKFTLDNVISIINFNIETNNENRKFYTNIEENNNSISILNYDNLDNCDLIPCKIQRKVISKNNLFKFNNNISDKLDEQQSKIIDRKSKKVNQINSENFLNLFHLRDTYTKEYDENTKYILKNQEIEHSKRIDLLNFKSLYKKDQNCFIKVLSNRLNKKTIYEDGLIINKNEDTNAKKTQRSSNFNILNNVKKSNNKEVKTVNDKIDTETINISSMNDSSGIKNLKHKVNFKILIDYPKRINNNSEKYFYSKINDIKDTSYSFSDDYLYYTKINLKKVIAKIVKVFNTKLSLLNKNIELKVENIIKNSGKEKVYQSDSFSSLNYNYNNLDNNNNINKVKHFNETIIKNTENNDIYLFSNEEIILQSLYNILSNSIKFTRVGTVLIEVSNEDNFVTIKIKDSGIGIEYEIFKKLGNPFVKSDKSNNIYGMGMGLYTIINNLRVLKGKCELISCVEIGTTIIFSIPKNLNIFMKKTSRSINNKNSNRTVNKSIVNLPGVISNLKDENIMFLNTYSSNINFLKSNIASVSKNKINKVFKNKFEQSSDTENNNLKDNKKESCEINSINEKTILDRANPKNSYTNNINFNKDSKENNNTFIDQQSSLSFNEKSFRREKTCRITNKINSKKSSIDIKLQDNICLDSKNEKMKKLTKASDKISLKIIPYEIDDVSSSIDYSFSNQEEMILKHKSIDNSVNDSKIFFRNKKSLSNKTKFNFNYRLEIPDINMNNKIYFKSNNINNQFLDRDYNFLNTNRRFSDNNRYRVIELSVSQDRSLDISDCNYNKDGEKNYCFSSNNINKYIKNYKFINSIKNQSSFRSNSDQFLIKNNINSEIEKSRNIKESKLSLNTSLKTDLASFNFKDIKSKIKSLSRFYDNQILGSNNIYSFLSSDGNLTKYFSNEIVHIRPNSYDTKNKDDNYFFDNFPKFKSKCDENNFKSNYAKTYKINSSESNICEKIIKEGQLNKKQVNIKNDFEKKNIDFNNNKTLLKENPDFLNKINLKSYNNESGKSSSKTNDYKILYLDNITEKLNRSEDINLITNRKNILRVLIVDDEIMIRKSHRKLFEKYFLKVLNEEIIIEECEDGIECLNKIYLGYKMGIQYNIIVTDETMNFLCGTSLAKIIFDLKKDLIINNIQLFLVTSYKITNLNSNNKDLYFTKCFNKPLTSLNIERLLNYYAENL